MAKYGVKLIEAHVYIMEFNVTLYVAVVKLDLSIYSYIYYHYLICILVEIMLNVKYPLHGNQAIYNCNCDHHFYANYFLRDKLLWEVTAKETLSSTVLMSLNLSPNCISQSRRLIAGD